LEGQRDVVRADRERSRAGYAFADWLVRSSHGFDHTQRRCKRWAGRAAPAIRAQ
jgi:hypothetical protein